MRRSLARTVPLSATAAVLATAAGVASGRPSVATLRDTLEDILASGYQLTEPPEAQALEWLARALRALNDLMGSFSRLGPLAGLPGWAEPVVTGALIVLLGLLVAHIYSGLRGLLIERRGGRDPQESRRSRPSPETLRQRAETAYRRGEYDAAVRLLYLAVLHRLDRLGLLTHDPARTNWENLEALRSSGPGGREAMAGLTRDIDGLLYGGRRATEQTWDRVRAWADLLWEGGEAG